LIPEVVIQMPDVNSIQYCYKNGLFGLIRLYLGLFGAIYWTTALVVIDQTFPE